MTLKASQSARAYPRNIGSVQPNLTLSTDFDPAVSGSLLKQLLPHTTKSQSVADEPLPYAAPYRHACRYVALFSIDPGWVSPGPPVSMRRRSKQRVEIMQIRPYQTKNGLDLHDPSTTRILFPTIRVTAHGRHAGGLKATPKPVSCLCCLMRYENTPI